MEIDLRIVMYDYDSCVATLGNAFKILEQGGVYK